MIISSVSSDLLTPPSSAGTRFATDRNCATGNGPGRRGGLIPRRPVPKPYSQVRYFSATQPVVLYWLKKRTFTQSRPSDAVGPSSTSPVAQVGTVVTTLPVIPGVSRTFSGPSATLMSASLVGSSSPLPAPADRHPFAIQPSMPRIAIFTHAYPSANDFGDSTWRWCRSTRS